MDGGVADVLGRGGVHRDPVWRITVELTAVERSLLRCWPVRRLAFIAHAGASSISTAQRCTRLEHSLGVLALAARFAPHDHLARAAALLHDVGHLPLSHTIEGVAGSDHHDLGAARVRELGPGPRPSVAEQVEELAGAHGWSQAHLRTFHIRQMTFVRCSTKVRDACHSSRVTSPSATAPHGDPVADAARAESDAPEAADGVGDQDEAPDSSEDLPEER